MKRRNNDANGVLVSSSSSSSSVRKHNSVADESCALASRDDNATGCSLQASSAAGDREGKRRTGASGGGSAVSSVGATSPLSWRERSWETPPSMDWER